ncbi:MAG: FHA domain-containing protein, partial [bacterium]
MAKLIIQKDKNEFLSYVIHKKLISIGRSPQCDLVLADNNISSLHANIINRKGMFQLIDMESTNGTKVNGAPISEKNLAYGDNIDIGRFTIIFSEEPVWEDNFATSIVKKDLLVKSQGQIDKLENHDLEMILSQIGREDPEQEVQSTL